MTDTYYDQSYPPSLWAPTPPTLTSVTPSTGVISTSVTLSIVGTKFTADTTVSMSGVPFTTTFVDSTHLTASGTLPATAGSKTITATNDEGTSNSIPFTVTATELQGTQVTPEEPTPEEPTPEEPTPEPA